jgi:hypothetical protein
MKPQPAPEVSGNTPWERLDNATRKIFTVSKESVVEDEAKRKKVRERKQQKLKTA